MSVIASLEALPTQGLTITALQTLDKVVPGEWSNQTRFDAIIQDVSGITRPGVVAAIRQRAHQLEAASPHYGHAVKVFGAIDMVDTVAAGAAVAGKLTSMFSGLSFLKEFTPKPETTQSLDAGAKLVAEVIGFGLLNGMPTTENGGLARFAGALEDYGRYDLIRIAAWVVFDGLLPLGPGFLPKIIGTFRNVASDHLVGNGAFGAVSAQIPGASPDEKRAFIINSLDTSAEWIQRFVDEKGLTQQGVMDQLQGVLSVTAGGMDYVAAAIDASTNYYAHTGTQTVARTLATHAVDAVRQDVWSRWVAQQA